MAVELVILTFQTPVEIWGLINLDISGEMCSLVSNYFNNCLALIYALYVHSLS